LESFTNPASTDNLNTPGVLHDVQHSAANDAIEAIEATLGVNPQGAFATVAAAITTLGALLNPSKVKATCTTVQTIANATNPAVAFTSEDFDTDGWHDNTTNNSRITCPAGKGGTYMVFGSLDFTANATGQRAITLRRNGAGSLTNIVVTAVGGFGNTAMQAVATIALVPGDYVELLCFQSSGGALDIAVSNFPPSLSAVYLGP
jgi:hypothetical protein